MYRIIVYSVVNYHTLVKQTGKLTGHPILIKAIALLAIILATMTKCT